MGKNDFLTPKAIGNRIKAKGLQKLRWYCQLCQKQCRDENGFKCHQTSESHRRQMELFGQHPGRVVAGFSEEFEAEFLEHLRRSHPSSRVAANIVYNEYIADRNHVHMNSTRWLTLTEFVKHLGRTGKCKVEETEKGWFMTLIRVDPVEAMTEAERLKRLRQEEEDEERMQRLLNAQVARAQKMARTDGGGDDGDGGECVTTELQRGEGDAPIKISLAAAGPGGAAAAAAAAAKAAADAKAAAAIAAAKAAALAVRAAGGGAAAPLFGDDDDDDGAGPSGRANGQQQQQQQQQQPRKLSKVEELMRRDLEDKARRAAATAATAAAGSSGRGGAAAGAGAPGAAGAAAGAAAAAAANGEPGRSDRSWLAEGLVVKVMSRALREAGYYKQKGVVTRVVGGGGYVAEIEMLDGGDVLRVDQAELETVLPAVGGEVRVVGGRRRGARGTLAGIDAGRYLARVRLLPAAAASSGTGAEGEDEEVWLDYEDVCKVAAAGGRK